jgi:GTP-binding protein EngB required for normal cell division
MSSTTRPLPTPPVECYPRQGYHKDQPDTSIPSSRKSTSRAPKRKAVIVMGATGTGKSSLIREITGNPEVIVSDGLNSCTTKVTPYSFEGEGEIITLFDTPGFGSTSRSELEVLTEISTWAGEAYRERHLLSGIIYLHRISDTRMGGSALKNLRLLTDLVGKSNLKNVVLATSHWSRVTPEEGEVREKELRETKDFWKGLLDDGATLGRWYTGDPQSGLELLRKFAQSEPRALDIQVQLVDQRRDLADTSAGRLVKKSCSEWKIQKSQKEKQIQKEEPHGALALFTTMKRAMGIRNVGFSCFCGGSRQDAQEGLVTAREKR